MRVTGDLGFSSLVLVVVWLVVPVIGFVIRRKWQLAVARREEIKRLLILAAEETARAESEQSYVYGVVSVATNNQCAVCYTPTPTRCARCKAVRYCSAKCQIIHWRQGHKDECHPASTFVQSDDVVSDLVQKEAEQDHHDNHGEKCETEDKQCKRSSKKPPLCTTSFSPKVSGGKDDDIRAEPLADGNITDSNSELSGNSFSGFSASTSSSESSDDASVCDSIISNEHEGSEGYIFVDPTLDRLDTISNDISMGATISLSPKFASLVDSVDGFSAQKLNQLMPGFSKEECDIASNGTSGLNMCNVVTIEPCTVSSGFQDKSHDSRKIKDGANDDPLPSGFKESTGKKESESESSICFSYSTLPPLHAQGPEARSSEYGDAFPNFVQNDKPSAGSASSENDSTDSLELRNSSSIDSKRSTDINYVTDQSESREDNLGPPLSSSVHQSSTVGKVSGHKDALNISNLKSVGSKVSNLLVENPDSTSHQLKSAEVRILPCNLADGQLASKTGGHSGLSTEFGNNGVQSGISSSSQVASCPPNSKNGLKSSVLKVVDQFRGSNMSKRFPLAVGSGIAGRYSGKGLFPYDLFVKLYNWNKLELRPFGLINCGNSCYANAVLQCLAFTPPLTAYLLQGLHSKTCATDKWCFTCEFESLILKSKGTKSPLSPVGILSQLQNIGSQLGSGREEDAHEFLRYAIDTMQSVCLMEAGVNTSGSLEEETTLMGLTFGGYLRSRIKCMKCGGKSERQERMMDLTVEIEGEIATLEEALRRFTSTETLDGENKYQCVRCKSYEKAKKKLTISEAPNVLTIALKRFQSGKFGKLNKPIRFPEILDLAPFMSGTSDKSPIYRLYGVVVHLDIMNAAFSGHYVCYVKNIQNKWFKVDDSVVTAVELDRVLTKGAYMLLYARCSPRAPRLIRNMIATPDSKSKVNGKTTTTKSRCISANSSAADYSTNSISPDGSSTLDSFYSKFHRLKRILEEDSSSDNSSLISSNSDEGSCSTDSTHDSTSTDDFSDYIFGDSGRGWNSMSRCSDSDTSSSSSSSPLYSRHSPLADMDRYDSGSPGATELQTPTGSSGTIDGPLYRLSCGVRRPTDIGRGSDSLLHSDKTIQNRNLDSSSRSSSSRETDSFRRLVSNHLKEIDSGVSCRKPRERTD